MMQELPEVFAEIGPEALPDLAASLADSSGGLFARGSAGDKQGSVTP